MMSDNEEHMDVCQNIESGLVQIYENHLDLSDKKVINAMNMGKIAIKQAFGFAKNESINPDACEQEVVDLLVAIGQQCIDEKVNLSLRDYCKLIEKIAKSVDRHNAYGPRGYYEFIKNYVM